MLTKTKKNFLYNTAYQVFAIIIPIVLAPFLSRRLGVDGNGIYSYTYSIVYYFALFVLLGMNNYGSRKIAKARESKEKMSRIFWELYALQIALGIIMIVLFFVFVIFIADDYKNIFVIQSLFIVAALLDVNWFFYGLEEFKITVVRSFIIKIVNFVSILIFVRSPEDIWKYALIMAVSAFANQIALWPFLKNKVVFIRPDMRKIKKHIKPLFVLFVPVIAVSIYKIMDKIMIGAIANVDEVGLYEYAEKINSIPLTVIAALGTVMMPKIANLIAKNSRKQIMEYLNKAIEFVLFISVPIFFVFLMGMNVIVPWYLGEDFMPVANIVIMLSVTLPFVSFANVIRTQYLIPAEKDGVYVKSVVIGAVINIVLNFLFIPKCGALGACFGTIAAEISVMVYQIACVRQELEMSRHFKKWMIILVKSLIAFTPMFAVGFIPMKELYRAIIQVCGFIIVYAMLNRKYIMNNSTLIKKIIHRRLK